jgi:hypothetical protein
VTPAAFAALIPIPGRCAKSYSAPRCWDTRLLRYGSPHYQTDAQLFQPSGYDCVGEVNSDVGRQLNRFERSGRPSPLNLRDTLFDVWETNNRVTVFLVEHLPAELWEVTVPGAPRRTSGCLPVTSTMPQIVMLARQLGYRLPLEVTGGLWQWSKRAREV